MAERTGPRTVEQRRPRCARCPKRTIPRLVVYMCGSTSRNDNPGVRCLWGEGKPGFDLSR